MDQNLKNWMLTGAIFLANAAMFLVATATFHSRTPGRRGPAAEGVMLLMTTITVATALTGAVIILVAAAVHETRQRAAAAATSADRPTQDPVVP